MATKKNEEVLTAEEVAELLRLTPLTIRKLAGQGKLPGRKTGAQWRFTRRAIDEYLSCPVTDGEPLVV